MSTVKVPDKKILIYIIAAVAGLIIITLFSFLLFSPIGRDISEM